MSFTIVDGGGLKLTGNGTNGGSDREEIAGLTSHFGFDDSLQPSIGNEPGPQNIEPVDIYLKKFSFYEPLGSISKTIDGIVIQSYAPFSSTSSQNRVYRTASAPTSNTLQNRFRIIGPPPSTAQNFRIKR